MAERKKILFIDRDGTLVIEPPVDYQLDSLEKLEFLPGVFNFLGKIVRELDFKLVMVTNQDGLGTDSFPEETFWPPQLKMLKAFELEGIEFEKIHVDKTFEEEKADTRKPRTGMLTQYFDEEKYDLKNSFVIGDRLTDVQLAENMGCQSIYIAEEADKSATVTCQNWGQIYKFLAINSRIGEVNRKTKETDIHVRINLDGTGQTNISTGLHFFDHMLDQIGKHSNSDLTIQVTGDLNVDEHHTIEDTALALGSAISEALGTKKGIERYAFVLPMDDCLCQVALDFGGRPWLVWDADFKREMIGDLPTEMFEHFFKSFSDTSKCNLNIKAEGKNEHHKIEGIFKALAKAIKQAKSIDYSNLSIPSTKGTL